MSSPLQNRTVIVTGASRGIGRAIALRCASAGANVVLAAKTAEPHPKLPGTIHTVREEIEAKGGKALAVATDVRFEEAVEAMVEQTVKAFGGVDIVVNNAGAMHLAPIDQTPMKRYDLMFDINARAPFLLASKCLPHLEKSDHAHILNLSPPLNYAEKWFASHAAYTASKYAMTTMALGLAAELKERKIAVNTLWPRTIIATAIIDFLLGDDGMKNARTPDIMADAAYEILASKDLTFTGQNFIDEDLLRATGVEDFAKYLVHPDSKPMPDLYVD